MQNYIKKTLEYYENNAEDYANQWTDDFLKNYDFTIPDILFGSGVTVKYLIVSEVTILFDTVYWLSLIIKYNKIPPYPIIILVSGLNFVVEGSVKAGRDP